MKSKNLGIELSDDFDLARYDDIHSIVHRLINSQAPLPEVWIEFSSGWNAIAFRFKALVFHDELIRNSRNGS